MKSGRKEKKPSPAGPHYFPYSPECGEGKFSEIGIAPVQLPGASRTRICCSVARLSLHPSDRGSPELRFTAFSGFRLGRRPRTRVNRLEKLAPLGAANPAPHVPSLDDEMVGGLPEANDDELGYLRAEEVRGVR